MTHETEWGLSPEDRVKGLSPEVLRKLLEKMESGQS